MTNDKSLRFEFAQSFLNKQNVAISSGSLDTCLKISEICSPIAMIWCVAGYYVFVVGIIGAFIIAVAAAAVTAGYAAGGVRTVMSYWTEFGGCSIENPLLTEKFNGMC